MCSEYLLDVYRKRRWDTVAETKCFLIKIFLCVCIYCIYKYVYTYTYTHMLPDMLNIHTLQSKQIEIDINSYVLDKPIFNHYFSLL